MLVAWPCSWYAPLQHEASQYLSHPLHASSNVSDSVRSASPVVRLPGSSVSRSEWGAASGTARLRSSVKGYRRHTAACPCASNRQAWAWMHRVQRAVGGVQHKHVRHRLLLVLRVLSLLPIWASPCGGGAGPLAKALRRFPVVGDGTGRHPVDLFHRVPRE